jgi:hypothetical protein
LRAPFDIDGMDNGGQRGVELDVGRRARRADGEVNSVGIGGGIRLRERIS